MQQRLIRNLVIRVRNGEITERGLARRTGISQPHIHNVLKGKRFFSWEAADAVLLELGLTIEDLVDDEEPPAGTDTAGYSEDSE